VLAGAADDDVVTHRIAGPAGCVVFCSFQSPFDIGHH
jgi:hypothetical protein